ncbi:type VI secretion system baseplate subunit TssF [Reinekea sp.]|jgi:type VI protein secretion system component VasA|uniref:type VI secretion system baseplate subunit TssF n=1 Tax=Reinekea sp. TaxID=1970455 RepID=UPI002A82E2D8|nr:type VI secretion system baseplate subunit TssF [Reinekea sp.]
MLKDHYEKILQQLRTDAAYLAERYPDLAVNLQRENTDPDVARLLEGVALVAARQAEQMAADRDEHTQGWLQAMAPELLLPLPAMVLAQAEVGAGVLALKGGSAFTSGSQDAVVAWQLAYDCTLLPLELTALAQTPQELCIEFTALGDIADFSRPIRIQLAGDLNDSQALAYHLATGVTERTFECGQLNTALPESAWQCAYQVADGSWLHSVDESVRPSRPRWLQECWCLPQRVLAFDLDLSLAMAQGQLAAGETFSLRLSLAQALPQKVALTQLALNVLPLINLQPSALLPFTRQLDKSLYQLALADERLSVQQLVAILSVREDMSNGDRHAYLPIAEEAQRSAAEGVYQLLRQTRQPQIQVRLDRPAPDTGLVMIDCLTHQGDDASRAQTGTALTGPVTGQLLCSPSQWIAAPGQQQAQWKLLQAQQSGQQRGDLQALVGQLHGLLPPEDSHFDERRRLLRAVEALHSLSVTAAPITRGTSIILGQEVILTLDSDAFRTEADCWQFCLLIWQLLRGRLAINSVMALRVRNQKQQDILYWPAASGTRAVI